MHESHHFLQALTIVLGTAGVTTLLFRRLRLPVVLGYIVAGLLIGPNFPFPLVADGSIVRTLSELGVILLMFSLGLEFSLRKVARVGGPAALIAVVETSIMLWLGFVIGRSFGWSTLESLFAGAAVAISSTTIIAKVFDEQSVSGGLRHGVFGILLIEDLIAILLLAALTPIATGSGLSGVLFASTVGRLIVFLFALLAVGMLIVPRLTRWVLHLESSEATLVATIGFCFGTALLALRFGYSVALGAFIAGSLIAESGEEKKIEYLVRPVRDMFAAIFFVSVGMLLEPAAVAQHWRAILAFTAVVLFGKTIGVTIASFLAGRGISTSVRSGMSLAQIGEFSFIIVALGMTVGAVRPFLYPVAVTVSALTTLMTPVFISQSNRVASAIDRRLPKQIQMYAALYGSWVERLGGSAPGEPSPIRRFLVLLLADVTLLGGLITGTALYWSDLGVLIERRVGTTVIVARIVVALAAAVIAVPIWIGIVRVVRRLSTVLAQRAFPLPGEGLPDLSAAPRAAMVVTLKIIILVLIGMPLVALTQPFLPGYHAAIALTVLLGLLVIGFWKTTTNLQGHVRAGAQAVVSALSRSNTRDADDRKSRSPIDDLLSAFGSPRMLTIEPESTVCGKQLREINLRGRTGAILLAIHRGDEPIVVPAAGEVLQPNDVVAIGGSADAVEAAAEILGERVPVPEPEIQSTR